MTREPGKRVEGVQVGGLGGGAMSGRREWEVVGKGERCNDHVVTSSAFLPR